MLFGNFLAPKKVCKRPFQGLLIRVAQPSKIRPRRPKKDLKRP